MLDMGFEPQIRRLIEEADCPASTPPPLDTSAGAGAGASNDDVFGLPAGARDSGRQTMMFSATFEPRLSALAARFLSSPATLRVRGGLGMAGGGQSTVTQAVEQVQDTRGAMLRATELLLEWREEKVIVFVNTKKAAADMAPKLRAACDATQVHICALPRVTARCHCHVSRPQLSPAQS